MKLIVGLGNPGSKYDKTKHNAGFWVIDELIRRSENSAEKNQCQALVTTCTLYGERVMLAKPQTFMNLSGHAVSEIVNYYHDRLDDILVIHDDLDLPVGKLRFKNGGSAGGHNGIKSIIAQLGSQDFNRLKFGIGKGGNTIDYVLSPFNGEDTKIIDSAVQTAADAVEVWLKQGLNKAMNEYN